MHPESLAERQLCGTGFSREGVGIHVAKSAVRTQASSRLKPVPLKKHRVHPEPLAERELCETEIHPPAHQSARKPQPSKRQIGDTANPSNVPTVTKRRFPDVRLQLFRSVRSYLRARRLEIGTQRDPSL